MTRLSGSYKHYIPEVNLSIERNTVAFRDDKFYVIHEGKIVAGFRSLKKAEENFRQILEEIGYKRPALSDRQFSPAEEDLDRYLVEKELYWAESHKYKGRGGKGGRGGI